MAKKRTKALSKSLIPEIAVRADVQIGMQEILCVAVAKIEKQLRTDSTAAQKALAAKEQDVSKVESSIRSAVNKAAKAKFDKKVESANKVLLDLGFKSKSDNYELCRTSCEHSIESQSWTHTIRLGENNYRDGACVETTVKFDAGLKRQCKALDKFQSELSECKHAVINARKRLADLPAYERQVRAKLVEKQLSGSEAGREILAQLDSDPQSLLALE